ADALLANRLQKPQPVEAALKLLEHTIRGSLHQSLNFQSSSLPDSRHSSQQRAQTSDLKGCLPIFSAALSPYQACLKSILDFFSDLVRLTSHADFEAGFFQAYLQIGQEIAVEVQCEAPELSQSFSNALRLLEQSSPIRYGRSLFRMWQSCRPITASSSVQLNQLNALERVADQFDALTLRIPNGAVSYANVRVKLLLAWEDALRTGTDTVKLV